MFSNEQSSAKTNLIKRAKQCKLLMKIWMMAMIQQKKLPPKLKENSSCDGLKAIPMAGLSSRKQQHEVQFTWLCSANIRISCDNFSLLWKSQVWTYFFLCCVCNFKIHSMFDISFWKHKLQTWKSKIIHVKCHHALAMLLTTEIGLLDLLHVKVYFKYFLN